MNRILKVAVILCLLASAPSALPQATASGQGTEAKKASLPTVNELTEKCAKAIGGKQAWSKLSTIVLKGTIEVPASGVSGTMEAFAKAPNKSLQQTSFGDGQFVQKRGFDGRVAWEFSSQDGLKLLEGAELEEARIDAAFDTELRLKELYPDMKVVGLEKIGNHDAYAVLAHKPGGKAVTFYFDAKTWLRIGEDSESAGKDGKVEKTRSLFEDYRELAGVQIPYRTVVSSPSVSFVVKVQEAHQNLSVEDAVFSVPAKQAANATRTVGQPSEEGPDDGEVNGNVYKNRFFAMEYEFPKGWTVHGEETKKRVMEAGKELVAGDDKAKKAAAETAEKHTRILLSVFQYPLGTPNVPNQTIQILSEDVRFAPGIQTGRDYWQNVAATMSSSNISMEMEGKPVEMRVGDKVFYRANFILHFGTKDIHEAFCTTIYKRHALAFVFVTGSGEETDSLVKTMESLKAGNSQWATK